MKPSKFVIPLSLLTLLLLSWSAQLPGAEPGSIVGNVYCDKNKDGACDCEERGLENVHIQIFIEHCGGTALQTVSTDEQGNFTFQHFEPGTYYIMADLDYACGSRVPTTVNCQQVTLATGETVTLPAIGYSELGQ